MTCCGVYFGGFFNDARVGNAYAVALCCLMKIAMTWFPSVLTNSDKAGGFASVLTVAMLADKVRGSRPSPILTYHLQLSTYHPIALSPHHPITPSVFEFILRLSVGFLRHSGGHERGQVVWVRVVAFASCG